jgi:hypothetical protein
MSMEHLQGKITIRDIIGLELGLFDKILFIVLGDKILLLVNHDKRRAGQDIKTVPGAS